LALEQRRTFWVQEALLQVQHLVMILAVLVPLWIHTQSKLFNAPKRILHDRVDSRHRTSEHGPLVLEPLVVLARRLRNANLVEMWQSNKHAQAGQQQRLAAQQAGAGLGMQGLQQAMAGQQAGTGLGLQGLQQGMAGQQLAGRLGQGLGQLGTSFGALGLQGAGQLGSLGAQYGSLGQGLGQLAGGLGRLGLSQAALGETLQGAQQRDINALMGLGGLEQQYNQRLRDAQRRTLVEREAAPYQSLGFMSDIFRGVPTTTSSLTASTAPSPSMISQIGGLGLGLAGLGQSGLFDGLFGRSQ
jgi:hypothetical protein